MLVLLALVLVLVLCLTPSRSRLGLWPAQPDSTQEVSEVALQLAMKLRRQVPSAPDDVGRGQSLGFLIDTK